MVAKKPTTPPTSLRFHRQEIPENGFHLSYHVRQDELGLTAAEGRVLDTLHLDCDIFTRTDGVHVKGTLAGTVIRECVRCLGEYQDLLVLPCLGLFRDESIEEPQSKVFTDDELDELTGDDVGEEYPYDDNHVALAGMLREQCILATPIQQLCLSDCLGLCQVCGVNLNHTQCGCQETIPCSPMVSALKQIKKNL